MGRPKKKIGRPSNFDRIANLLVPLKDDPYKYVMANWPWREEGTPLADETGPDVWQKEVLDKIGEATRNWETTQIAVRSGHSVGKVQPNSLVMDTPDGERLWGDLDVGDYVWGANGEKTRITAKFPHKDWQFYKVTFDDGSFTFCGKEHLWNVRGRQERRKGLAGWRTISLEDILDIGVKRSNGIRMTNQWEIPLAAPVNYKYKKTVIPPYLYGAYLGNGGKSGKTGRLSCNHIDWDHWVSEITKYYDIGENRKEINTLSILKFKKKFDSYGIAKGNALRVHDDFKYNSVEVRLAVLQGLLDTDGNVRGRSGAEFTSISRQLVDDVIWLARSLGFKAKDCKPKENPFYRDKDGNKIFCQTAYRCFIANNGIFDLFRLGRKQCSLEQVAPRWSAKWIDAVEPAFVSDGHCIMVDAPDQLYLTNDFIVTHNSCLISWIINYFMMTRSHPQIIVTANTAAQLSSKTWRELAKWHKMALNKDFFEWAATRYSQINNKEDWFAAAIPWSERNSEAFAGAHETRKHSAVLVIFDEASGIPDTIWEVASGAMSTPGSIFLAFGNPTQNTGRFRECWGKFRHRWHGVTVDARNAKKADQELINEWINDYGLDSDFVRVRVLGEFPKQASNQFISSEDVRRAVENTVDHYRNSVKVMGFDVARFGDDSSVIVVRQGRKVLAIEKRRGLDTMQAVGFLLEMRTKHQPHVVYIDLGYVGAAVYDRIKEQGLGRGLVGVNFGGDADDPTKYRNKRAEIWDRTKQWLHEGNCDIPDDTELVADLTGPRYSPTSDERLVLESKKDMKRRGLASPDNGDALCLTFSQPYDLIGRYGAGANPIARQRAARRSSRKQRMMSRSPAGY